MILQNLALKKGKEVAGHNIQSWTKHKRHCPANAHDGRRYVTQDRRGSAQLKKDLAREHVKDLSDKQKAKREARAIDKDFFMSVLNSSATRREAKSYLANFTPAKEATSSTKTPVSPESKASKPYANGINLGGLYGPTAVQESPKFVQQPQKQQKVVKSPRQHVALVKIRAPQTLDDAILNGIGRTLSQLARLGLISVIVVDCNVANGSRTEVSGRDRRGLEAEQAQRIVTSIESNGRIAARIVDNVIGVYEGDTKPGYAHVQTHVTLRPLLMTPLRKGVIPVIPSVGYTDITQRVVSAPAANVVMALTRELAGLPTELQPDEDPNVVRERLQALRDEVSLDRLIILDPLGGIPSSDRLNGYHVFLNMEQEFEPAKEDLLKGLHESETPLETRPTSVSSLGASNPFSKFVELEFGNPSGSTQSQLSPDEQSPKSDNWFHLQNLQLARSVLSILPPSSSALLTTPDEAANSGREGPFQPARVGTRRQRNPLIHNLLTDRPAFSSSLPMGRLGARQNDLNDLTITETITPTTFAKHGTSVTLFPDPYITRWEPPTAGKPQLTLTDSQIDLPRLVHLIEDSFGRKLDVKEYLKRVNHRIAGVIIAGEYEGGALLTWETPPGVVDDGSEESRARMVPYLDKFAVLKKKQGSATADLVFKAMVRDCFPHGVCWRSRKDNVVNKWYFERSRGTWKLPDTGWTMFWTTADLSLDRQTFLDYEGVCRNIQPSWADNKALLD